MPECPFIDYCPAFRVLGRVSGGRELIARYCRGNFMECKRFQVRVLGRAPPPELLPNGATLEARRAPRLFSTPRPRLSTIAEKPSITGTAGP